MTTPTPPSCSILPTWALALIPALGFACPVPAQQALFTWQGQSNTCFGTDGEQLGRSVAGLGDVDGDGVPDVLVGAPGADGMNLCSGKVVLFSGATGLVLRQLLGEGMNDSFGRSVAAVGDANGDGTTDFAVGAPGFDGAAGAICGKAYLYSGATGGLLRSWEGETYSAYLGWSVAAAGDVDGDGRGDVLVGAFGHRSGITTIGKAYVYSGATGLLLQSFLGQGGSFGKTVAGAGDVDGDGALDVAVASPDFNGPAGSFAGRVQVFSALSGAPVFTWDGEGFGDRFGTGLTTAGDLDGDTVSDLAVGAPFHSGAAGQSTGKAYVYSGATTALVFSWEGDVPGAGLGDALAQAGDVNRDGTPDLLIGASGYDGPSGINSGRAHLISGWSGIELWHWDGQGSFDELGAALASAGDLDGDSIPDAVVGAWHYDGGIGIHHGRVHVFAGNDLYLSVEPTPVAPGQTLVVRTRGGIPGSPTALVLVELAGTPVFLPFLYGAVDPAGQWTVAVPIPRGLSGLTAALKSYSIHPALGLVDSNRRRVVFQ